MDLSFFDDLDTPPELKIRIYPTSAKDLGDNKDKHRWRAKWDTDYIGGTVIGIALSAYPVVRLTPRGAWIDQYAYFEATKQPWEDGAPANEWVTTADRSLWKWVSDDGGQAWAKPTQEDAIRSIAIRLHRWAGKLHRENEKMREAINAMRIVRPDLSRFADDAAAIMGGVE
ncbi:MAG: hypothetical protein H6881_08155 [Rhodobiaceae bacterium]|nr:hypothetical protein [Rhodobiaceae bacterium]MCC0051835.1 hypothetical protein [Rhodobiaceae bacterium]